MFSGKWNPAHVYAVIVDGLAVLIGMGVLYWTDAQQDIVLKFVAAIILAVTGVAVPAGKAVDTQVREARIEGIQATNRGA